MVEETLGVHRFQLIQAAPTRLTVRLEPAPGGDRAQVVAAIAERWGRFLADQGLPAVAVEFPDELPIPSRRSGKLRQVSTAFPPPVADGGRRQPDR